MLETRKRFWHKLAREKEVVEELFEDYLRTGSLHRPWGAVDLDGDALSTVFEVCLRVGECVWCVHAVTVDSCVQAIGCWGFGQRRTGYDH